MDKTRIAVAGAGIIGLAHMDVAQRSPTCTLSAIVDPAPATEAIAAKAGVPLYKSLDELFEKNRPDGVILATPNQLHLEHALKCITAGVRVDRRDELESTWKLFSPQTSREIATRRHHAIRPLAGHWYSLNLVPLV